MKNLLLLSIILFLSSHCIAQIILFGVELDRGNSASIRSNSAAGKFSSYSSFGLNADVQFDRKKFNNAQHGFMLDFKNYLHRTDEISSLNYKLGIYYSTNFGYDMKENDSKIATSVYIGPHINIGLPFSVIPTSN